MGRHPFLPGRNFRRSNAHTHHPALDLDKVLLQIALRPQPTTRLAILTRTKLPNWGIYPHPSALSRIFGKKLAIGFELALFFQINSFLVTELHRLTRILDLYKRFLSLDFFFTIKIIYSLCRVDLFGIIYLQI
jgi:hypothetical protein